MGLVNSSSTSVTLRAIASGLSGTGLVLTILRLAYRMWLRRFWVEDAWAAVAFVCGVATLTTCWTYMKGAGEEAIISFWIYSFGFPCTVWAVRQSILFSIARIVYETQHLRRLLICLGLLFFGMWAGDIAQKAWQYGHNISWYHAPGKPHTFMTRPAILYELIIDFLSDTILIILPLRLLWSLKLPKRQKRMILAIFTSGIIVVVASIFRAVCQLGRYATVMATATDFETASALLVLNLLVVVTFLYRILGFVDADDGASSDDDYTTRAAITRTTAQTTAQILTTVDLDEFGIGSDERAGKSRMQARKVSFAKMDPFYLSKNVTAQTNS